MNAITIHVDAIGRADRQARLLACDLVRTRFPGRAALRNSAASSEVALARLELRLGLATETDVTAAERSTILRSYTNRLMGLALIVGFVGWEKVEQQAAARYARGPRVGAGVETTAAAIAPRQCAEIDAARARRAARPVDALGAREPLWAARTIAQLRAAEIVRAAGWRTAKHSHETTIRGVAPGAEAAHSVTGTARPQSVGLSNAYARKAFFVATSEHVVEASPAILSPEVRVLQAEAPAGVVYLRVDLRVRQGRGTSLVVERRSGARGGWS